MRTAFLARRASTSKSRLKKGSRAVLKPGWAPQSLRFSPQALQPPGRTLAPLVVCWRDTTSITRQGRERRCPHGSLNTEE